MTAPRLRELHLRSYGPFENAVIRVPEDASLLLFEGPNGSGKTSLLHAISVLLGLPRNATFGDMEVEFPHGVVAPPSFPTAPRVREFLRRCRDEAGSSVTASLVPESEVEARCEGARVVMHRKGGGAIEALNQFQNAALRGGATSFAAFAYGHVATPTPELKTEGPKEISTHPLYGSLSFGERPWAPLGQLLVNLEYARTQAKTYAVEEGAEVERDRLRQLASSHGAALERFTDALSLLIGMRLRVHFKPGRQTPRVTFNDEEVPLDLLGEGFRRTISWASDLVWRLHHVRWTDEARSPFDQDFWLIIDEIDQSLHPDLQRRVLPAIRELFPRAIILATTHSPFTVASATEGVVFRLEQDSRHRVTGEIPFVRLRPGQSVPWAIEEVFHVPSNIVDGDTVAKIEAHRADLKRIARGEAVDAKVFRERRAGLEGLGPEIAAMISIEEAGLRERIAQLLAGAGE